MSNHDGTEATIAMLERSIEEAEQKIRALRIAINTICAEAGMPQRYPDVALAGSGGSRLLQIKDDTFYGKKQTPAMREYLEMRKAQNLGPAKPREFFEALKAGGYQFEAKDDETAIVGLRALLRTQPQIFHRLPQGTYGLTEWYPDAKRQREAKAASKRGTTKRKKKVASRKPAEREVVEDERIKFRMIDEGPIKDSRASEHPRMPLKVSGTG